MYLIHITRQKQFTCNGCGVQSVVNFIEDKMFKQQAGQVYCRTCATEYNVYPRAREIEISYYKRMNRLFKSLLEEAYALNMDVSVFYKYPTKESVSAFINIITTHDNSNIKVVEKMTQDRTPIPIWKFLFYKPIYTGRTGKLKKKELVDDVTLWYGTFDVFYDYIQSEFIKMGLGVNEPTSKKVEPK